MKEKQISKFKVGDKVVPKSKTAGIFTFQECSQWSRAQEIGQPFLYVIKHGGYSFKDAYILNAFVSATSGGYYAEEDLELYQEKLDLTTPRLVTEDILVRVRNSYGKSWRERYLAYITPNGSIYCWPQDRTGDAVKWDPKMMIRWDQVEEIPKKKTVTLELTEEQLEKIKKLL